MSGARRLSRFRTAFLVLLTAASAPAASLSDEVSLDQPVLHRPRTFEQSLIYDGCRLVVLARQDRLPRDGVVDSPDQVTVGARVGVDGTVMDPSGVIVPVESGVGFRNGGEILLLEGGDTGAIARLSTDFELLDRIPGLAATTFDAFLCGAADCLLFTRQGPVRYSHAGVRQSETLFHVENGGWLHAYTGAIDGADYLVAWTDERAAGGHAVFTARVASGAARAELGASIALSDRSLAGVELVQGSGGWLAVSANDRDPVDLDALGKVYAVPLSGGSPTVIADDAHGYAVDAWSVGDEYRVAAAGQPLPNGEISPSATVVRLSRAGKELARRTVERPFGDAAETPEGRFILDDRLGLHRLSPEGDPAGDALDAIVSRVPQSGARVVAGRDAVQLAFLFADPEGPSYRTARLGRDGRPLDATSSALAAFPPPPADSFSTPRYGLEMASTGSEVFAAYQDELGRLRSVAIRGAEIDASTPLDLPADPGTLLLHDGDPFVLATWLERQGCGEDCRQSRVLAMPLGTGAAPVLGAPVVLADWVRFGGMEAGRASFDGTVWMVPILPPPGFGGGARRLDLVSIASDGTVRFANVDLGTVSGTTSIRRPRAAFGSGEHLVVYEQFEMTGDVVTGARVLALRLDDSLGAIDPTPFPVFDGEGLARGPEVVFDGEAFVVAWRHRWPGRTDWDVLAARVLPGTTPLAADCVAISAGPGDELGVTIAAGDPGVALVGYHRLDLDPSLVSSRVMVRALSGAGEGAPGCAAPEAGSPEKRPFQASCDGSVVEPESAARRYAGCGCEVRAANGGSVGSTALLLCVFLWVAGAFSPSRRDRSARFRSVRSRRRCGSRGSGLE